MLRRDFLNTSKALGLGALIGPSFVINHLLSKQKLGQIGLQLYTLRDMLAEDLLGTLRAIKEVGYDHIESAGYSNSRFYGQPVKNFKEIIDGAGLKMYSGHCSTGFGGEKSDISMTNKWEQLCEDAALSGQKYIVLGYLQEGERKSINDYKKHAALFNKCGEVAKKYRMKFCYHNHDFEFIKLDGELPYDVLLKETDPELVSFEMDHYWTNKAGVDGLKIIKKNKGRFPLFHLKDMDKTSDTFFAPVGSGSLDFKKILRSGENAGLDLVYVEQDAFRDILPMEAVTQSYDYLSKLEF